MKTLTIKSQKHFEESGERRTIDQAIRKEKYLSSKSLVQASKIDYLPNQRSLLIGFEDQTAVSLPIENYPEFNDLNVTDFDKMNLCFDGTVLCIEDRDMHVSIEGLISANKMIMDLAKKMVAIQNGRQRTEIKAEASRVNGLKGGRPRKTVLIE